MTNEEAVAIVCAVGRRIEEELMAAETEAYLRSWKPSKPKRSRDEEVGMFGEDYVQGLPKVCDNGSMQEQSRVLPAVEE